MANEKRDFEYECLQDTDSVVAYLKAVADGFERGLLTLSDNKGQLTLEPRGLIEFEVRASSKRDRAKVTLTLSWRPVTKSEEGASGPLFITTRNE